MALFLQDKFQALWSYFIRFIFKHFERKYATYKTRSCFSSLGIFKSCFTQRNSATTLPKRLTSQFICLIGFSQFLTHFALANSYFEFRGAKQGWHFNLLNRQAVIGLEGAFSSLEKCELQRIQKPLGVTGPCYLRQTLKYYRWQRQQMKAWVLPVKSGRKSKRLIMPNLEWCRRVASSAFYYTNEKVKIPKRPHFKRCLPAWVTFAEVETRYAFVNKHKDEPLASMQLFKAWSFPANQGQYVTLLQFPSKTRCEMVANQGFYDESIFSGAMSERKIKRYFNLKYAICQKRSPKINEIPLIYR